MRHLSAGSILLVSLEALSAAKPIHAQLAPSDTDHRRVLAVLRYLES